MRRWKWEVYLKVGVPLSPTKLSLLLNFAFFFTLFFLSFYWNYLIICWFVISAPKNSTKKCVFRDIPDFASKQRKSKVVLTYHFDRTQCLVDLLTCWITHAGKKFFKRKDSLLPIYFWMSIKAKYGKIKGIWRIHNGRDLKAALSRNANMKLFTQWEL